MNWLLTILLALGLVVLAFELKSIAFALLAFGMILFLVVHLLEKFFPRTK